jgi:aldehyde dehydrogenase (NAD+)
MKEIVHTERDISIELERLFQLQHANQYNIANCNAGERIRKLKRLEHALLKYRPEIKKAMYDDFKKPEFEVDGLEVLPMINNIRNCIRNLRRWMKPLKVPATLSLLGSTSWVHYEAKGVCLIVSPWNFPFNLSFVPLTSAISAGNCVILKPSEHTPHSSSLIKKIVNEVFDKNEIEVVEGDAEVSKALLELPFNHIFFTGAPSIGKLVMKAASKHLTSVTLELGGKTPTIIDETADIQNAVVSTSFAKYANCGQICIAPDYILVHESREKEFVEKLKREISDSFGNEPDTSDSYTRVVNNNHLIRLKAYLEDAIEKGANIKHGGRYDSNVNHMEPTLVSEVNMDMILMREEIFGPILPIRTFKEISEVTNFINEGQRPLALYIYSKNKKNINFIINNTRAGGTCINNSSMHFMNHHLPFGGINNSGIGKTHGWYGFQDFSNSRAIYRQDLPSLMTLFKPPYTRLKEKAVDLLIRWF